MIFVPLHVPTRRFRFVRRHDGPNLLRRNCAGHQVSHAHQVVGGAGEGKDPIYLQGSAMKHFAQQRDGLQLQPAKTFFDASRQRNFYRLRVFPPKGTTSGLPGSIRGLTSVVTAQLLRTRCESTLPRVAAGYRWSRQYRPTLRCRLLLQRV